MQLESVEEQLQSSSSVKRSAGVSREELEKERDMLKMKRDTLDAQLKDNRVLTAHVRKAARVVALCTRLNIFTVVLLFFTFCLSLNRKSTAFCNWRKLLKL